MWSMCRVQQYQALVRVREQKRLSTSVPSLHCSIGVRCTCQTSKTATGNSLSLSHAVYYCVGYSPLSSTFSTESALTVDTPPFAPSLLTYLPISKTCRHESALFSSLAAINKPSLFLRPFTHIHQVLLSALPLHPDTCRK